MVFSGFVGSNLRVDKEFNSLHNWAASALSLFFVAVCVCVCVCVCVGGGRREEGDERGKVVFRLCMS
jgi:ABC-type spermidine/putrescine transport system permease subunit I